ncbi:MAG: hypothetical protein KIS95_13240 [Anaerolineae bacterium]|uniref:hypothetical protein n=1 Tax=Promineifilum sp. TaxID=2664178 RepID=UPI001D307015|nr:hypothetical protein [Anaerolineales bacterium]MCB8935988.1 hypothetical protein [Promineifilum sp.]MCO5181663.1 hypothetical protein [Promineifilum sp.]MCW5848193.1 hypothetical protein [Anaerolineae bacterium]
MRVLIADERPSVRAALRAVLEHDSACEGIDEVVEVDDAMSALAFGADLLLVEWGSSRPLIRLPARAKVMHPGLIVVALGRHGGAAEQALAAGADYYIDTTEPPANFIDLLHEICPEARSAARQEF